MATFNAYPATRIQMPNFAQALVQAQKVKGVQQQQRLREMQMDAYQRDQDRQQKTAELRARDIKAGGSSDELMAADPDAAAKLDEGLQKRQAFRAYSFARAVERAETPEQVMELALRAGRTPEQAQQAAANFAANPDAYRQDAAMGALSIKEQFGQRNVDRNYRAGRQDAANTQAYRGATLDLQRRADARAEAAARVEKDPIAGLRARAAAGGLKPGAPEYTDFMLRNGAQATDPIAALRARALESGLQPGSPEYGEFMRSGGAVAKPDPKTEIARLLNERDALPEGDPRRSFYDAAIQKKVTASGMSLNVGPDGSIQLRQGAGVTDGEVLSGSPNQFAKKLAESDVRRLDAVRGQADAADDIESAANRLDMLSGDVGYTGPGGKIYGAVDDVIGILPGDAGARGAFRGLSLESRLSFTEKTKGAITDREMADFETAAAGLGQTPEGNKAIARAMRAGAQRVKTRAEFFNAYARKFKTLDGVQAQWSKYMRENPIIKKSDDGMLDINEIADFRPYIKTPEYEGLPPAPEGFTGQSWQRAWQYMSPDDKKLFLENSR